MNRRLALSTLVAACVLAAGPALAQHPTFHAVLDDADKAAYPVGSPGVVTFHATIKNNGVSPVYINGATITLTHPSGFSIDDTKFYLNVPTVLAGGASQSGIAVFDVTVPTGLADLTQVFGSIQWIGGSSASSQTELDLNHFRITIVPEGESFALLAAGVAAMALGMRRRRGLGNTVTEGAGR